MDAIIDPRIREGLFRAQPRTLDEAIEAALNVEAFVKMESGRRQESRYTGYSRALGEEQTVKPVEVVGDQLEKAVEELIARAENRIQQMLNRVAPQSHDRPSQTCYKCGGRGHFARGCPHPQQLTSNTNSGWRCFHCNETGHFKKNCPHRQPRSANRSEMNSQPESVQVPMEQKSETSGEESLPGVGQAKVGSSPDAEREGLYVEGRVNGQNVSFLIDTGSSNTLISKEVFERIDESRRSCLQSGAKPVFQADGTPLSVFGRATVEVAVGDAGFVTEVKVARLQNEGILGLDLLMQMNAVLDCRKLELLTPWGKLTCKNQHGAPFCGRTVETELQGASGGHGVAMPAATRVNVDSEGPELGAATRGETDRFQQRRTAKVTAGQQPQQNCSSHHERKRQRRTSYGRESGYDDGRLPRKPTRNKRNLRDSQSPRDSSKSDEATDREKSQRGYPQRDYIPHQPRREDWPQSSRRSRGRSSRWRSRVGDERNQINMNW